MGERVEWSFALKSAFNKKKKKSRESKKESKRGILCFCKKSHLLLSDADEAFPVSLSREPGKHTGLIPIYCSAFRGAEETDGRAI